MKKVLLVLILIPYLIFGEEVNEQLKKTGYKDMIQVLEESKEKSIRYRSIYPDGNEKKESPADAIYGNDYIIKDVSDSEGLKDKVVMYHPAIDGNSLFGLTGLVNTISAKSLKKGEYSIGGKYVYTKIDKSKDEDLNLVDGEKATISSFYITAAMGVSQNFELGYVLPVHSFEIIDDILYPYNNKESGVGDVALRAKFSFPFGNENGYAGLGFGLKLPSGNDEKMSPAGVSGEPDLEIIGCVSSQFGLLNGHFNVVYAFTGNEDNTGTRPYTFSDDKFTFNFGLDYSKNSMVTLMMEVNGEDWGAFGDRADLVTGVRARIGDKMTGDIAFPLSIHNNQYYGYKFKLIMGASYKF